MIWPPVYSHKLHKYTGGFNLSCILLPIKRLFSRQVKSSTAKGTVETADYFTVISSYSLVPRPSFTA